MKILFTYPNFPHQEWEGEAAIQRAKRLLLAGKDHPYTLSESAEEAEIIIFFEPVIYKEDSYKKILQDEPLIKRFKEKCFTFNIDTHPKFFLPGMYTSIKNSEIKNLKQIRAGFYPFAPTNVFEEYVDHRIAPSLLFSFRGASSAEVRKEIFESATLSSNGLITFVDRWFNHTVEEKHAYCKEILESKFVLCPRGKSPSSHRLYEVMELGRVPVIISDEWVPPLGPNWQSFSIRVGEKYIKDIPKILREYENKSELMGLRAKEEWKKWLSPAKRIPILLSYIEDILKNT